MSRRQNSKTIISLCELYHAQSSGFIQNLVSKVTQDGTNWRKKDDAVQMCLFVAIYKDGNYLIGSVAKARAM